MSSGLRTVALTIDGRDIAVPAGTTIREAARRLGIYVPVLCHHPDLPPAEGAAPSEALYRGGCRIENAAPRGEGCGICAVAVAGRAELVKSCAAPVEEGMAVSTAGEPVLAARRARLAAILARHPHACLTCAQRAGCSRTACSAGVPEAERCCAKFGACELAQVAEAIGIPPETPRYVPPDRIARADHRLFVREERLCIGCTRCVRACRELRGVGAIGFVVDRSGRSMIGTLGGSLESSGCRFCTACVAVCPTGALMDAPGIDAGREPSRVPCRAACPVGMDVPGYVRAVAAGRLEEAGRIVGERTSFPGVLGRVCTRPCETLCRRGRLDEPVAICALKRLAADHGPGRPPGAPARAAASGKRVAVIGAGPAGLEAAVILRRRGHAVTVFEAREAAGGMLRYGIPAFRLPRALLDRELEAVWELGVAFAPEKALGRDFSLDDLFAQGFAAVFIAIGAQQGRPVAIPGGAAAGVLRGVEFLRQAAAGAALPPAARVAVVGGGNVAVDAARAALRCGAAEVHLICLEPRSAMPAGAEEVAAALAEGVRIWDGTALDRAVEASGGRLELELSVCAGLRRAPEGERPQRGGRRGSLAVERLILAVGEMPDLAGLGSDGPIRTAAGRIMVSGPEGATSHPRVFAGGDVVQAPGSVVEALAAGRRAAAAIDRLLGGGGGIDGPAAARGPAAPRLGWGGEAVIRPRVPVPERDPRERARDFAEAVLGYGPEAARLEAERCLQCDLRLELRSNPPPPPANARPFNAENLMPVPASAGVYQLLDGARRVLAIRGTDDLRRSLLEELGRGADAAWFEFEEDEMYSRREREWLQRHLQRDGRLPGDGAEDLDELY